MVEVLENLSIIYRPDLKILFCRFIQPVTSSQLRRSYDFALGIAQQEQARFWLFDLRRRGPTQAEDENWLLNQFFPRAQALSKHYQYFAYLVTPTHYVYLRDNIGFEKLNNYSQILKINVFDSEEKAVQWLTNKQTQNT